MSIAAQLRQGNAGKVVGGMKQLGLFGFKAISASRHVAEMRLNDVAVAEKEEAEKLARSERAIARKEELAAKAREIRKRMREGGRPGLSDEATAAHIRPARSGRTEDARHAGNPR